MKGETRRRFLSRDGTSPRERGDRRGRGRGRRRTNKMRGNGGRRCRCHGSSGALLVGRGEGREPRDGTAVGFDNNKPSLRKRNGPLLLRTTYYFSALESQSFSGEC